MNGAPESSKAGSTQDQKEQENAELRPVIQALEVIYDPRAPNHSRHDATTFLEQAKRHPEAPATGIALALNQSLAPALRFYGLSMLEHAIKFTWEDYNDEQARALRQSVIQLAQGVTPDDPVFFRNKVGQLWVDLAKRSWAAQWTDMDTLLVQLWDASLPHQAVVLYVLETLAEEIFTKEDPLAGLRGQELGRACVEIFTPAAVLEEHLPNRDKDKILELRAGPDGWLIRLSRLLQECLSNDFRNNRIVQHCAVKSLNVMRAAISWLLPSAIKATNIIDQICHALDQATSTVGSNSGSSCTAIQQAAVEALYECYKRPHLVEMAEEGYIEQLVPLLHPKRVQLFQTVYESTDPNCAPSDVDEQKYALCKKLSELLAILGTFVEKRPRTLQQGSNFASLFGLFHRILRHSSLVVSIPILHSFTKLLRSREVRQLQVIGELSRDLLDLCTVRLLRYESLPDDVEDPTILFLNEDLDTKPEKHAFLGNYRRYCIDIIEVLARAYPVESMPILLDNASNYFQRMLHDVGTFKAEKFSKTSMALLQFDCHTTVLESGIRGYMKWIANRAQTAPVDEQAVTDLLNKFEAWCTELLRMPLEDPEMLKKLIGLLVSFSVKPLADRPHFALMLLEYILDSPKPEIPELLQYSDSVKDLERTGSQEMQRLASVFSDYFSEHLDEINQKLATMAQRGLADETRQASSFLALRYIIIHRASGIDQATKRQMLQQMVQPIKNEWQDSTFTTALKDFHGFCDLVGFGTLSDFLSQKHFDKVEDWSRQPLDEDGKQLQAFILKQTLHLPFRNTRALLGASTDRMSHEDAAHTISRDMWADAIPAILPNLLQLVHHAQAFNNMESWGHLPRNLQLVIKRALTDRFWQAGISTESRDDFFARVSGSKTTYEGFASTIRGTVRQIRESCYYVLYALTRFGDVFYGISDLPEPLARALFTNANSLSAHHLSVLLSATTHIIDGCPARYRSQFLPLMIAGLFRELNTKIAKEWETIVLHTENEGVGDDLSNEMKTESIVRQLTYSSVCLVSVLLETQKPHNASPKDDSETSSEKSQPMKDFILTTPSTLEPLLIFVKTAIGLRDSRSCTLILRTLRSIFPYFKDQSPVRDYICCDILQAAITSLHHPYFVDVQKDLASIIALIIQLDPHMTTDILLSLEGLRARPDRAKEKIKLIVGSGSERVQRSLVLDLLSSVRGVSIHEAGKMARSKRKVGEEYMRMEEERGVGIVRGGSPAGGLAEMFGEG